MRGELFDVVAISIVCEDCGHRRRWTRSTIEAVAVRWGVRSIPELGGRLRCKHCGERGGFGDNVSLWPTCRVRSAA